MACVGCARRAKTLFRKLGLDYRILGPNHRHQWIFETDDVAVLVPAMTAKTKTTRAAILVMLARFLFGRCRASEAPTPTEVWRFKEMSPSDLKQFFCKGTTIVMRQRGSFVEVRRGPWLRLVGPIEETLIADECSHDVKAGVT
jgi:hypothetical protein